MNPRALFALSAVLLAACSDDPPSSGLDAMVDTGVIEDSSADATDAGAPVTVMTGSGPVVGAVRGGVASFLGVPYAAPPVGALRWRPPRAPAPWSAPLAATDPGPACPQAPSTTTGVRVTGEDCLRVHVWTPDVRPASPLPVMVWIHGGGFNQGWGADPLYDGARLASEHRVVVVTVNYRLGQLGFLAHPALTAEDTEHHSSGNYGLLDQLAALGWVRDNVARFGGDPARVTLFGESAGGVSVGALVLSPLGEGLFHRAVVQSGPALFLNAPLRGAGATAEGLGALFARALGCDTASDVPACLRAKSAAEVLAAEPRATELTRDVRYWPNLDGYVLPDTPRALLQSGRFRRVPIVLGTNRDEGTGFTFQSPVRTRAALEAEVRRLLGDSAPTALALYPEAEFPNPNDALSAFLADAVFICPLRLQARLSRAAGVPVYLYHFTRQNPSAFGRLLGVFHGAEIPYVFGNFVAPFNPGSEEDSVHRLASGYWARFAATGDPNGGGATAWPLYEATSEQHLELSLEARVASGLRRARCEALEPLL